MQFHVVYDSHFITVPRDEKFNKEIEPKNWKDSIIFEREKAIDNEDIKRNIVVPEFQEEWLDIWQESGSQWLWQAISRHQKGHKKTPDLVIVINYEDEDIKVNQGNTSDNVGGADIPSNTGIEVPAASPTPSPVQTDPSHENYFLTGAKGFEEQSAESIRKWGDCVNKSCGRFWSRSTQGHLEELMHLKEGWC